MAWQSVPADLNKAGTFIKLTSSAREILEASKIKVGVTTRILSCNCLEVLPDPGIHAQPHHWSTNTLPAIAGLGPGLDTGLILIFGRGRNTLSYSASGEKSCSLGVMSLLPPPVPSCPPRSGETTGDGRGLRGVSNWLTGYMELRVRVCCAAGLVSGGGGAREMDWRVRSARDVRLADC